MANSKKELTPEEQQAAADRAAKRQARRAHGQCLRGSQIEQEFGLPYRTVYDLHLRGQLPAIRLNRSIWFRRADIEALLAKSIEVCS